jgi:hypothetical protein
MSHASTGHTLKPECGIIAGLLRNALTADKTGFSQIIGKEEVLEPLILSASSFICG